MNSAAPPMPRVPGRSVILAGSCAQATRQQIDAVRDHLPLLKLDADAIARGDAVAQQAADWAVEAGSTPVIYASADPDEVAQTQKHHGAQHAGEMIERTFAEIARTLVARDFRQIVVAGGETSGAVLEGLGVSALKIHAEIAPGVPWTTTQDDRLALALKSGNFGGPDFFSRAFEVLA